MLAVLNLTWSSEKKSTNYSHPFLLTKFIKYTRKKCAQPEAKTLYLGSCYRIIDNEDEPNEKFRGSYNDNSVNADFFGELYFVFNI